MRCENSIIDKMALGSIKESQRKIVRKKIKKLENIFDESKHSIGWAYNPNDLMK